MNKIEHQMLDLLYDLKENHGVIGLKAEFEDEGATFNDVLRLKNFAVETGLELTVKIGGGSALNDMNKAKKIGADSVVAPMIESPYSANKFLNTAEKVFSKNTKLFINIETKYALNYINEILERNYTGIVLGRTDLSASLGFRSDDVNNDRILEIAKEVSCLAEKSGKEFIVGGSVSALSINFFKSLKYLTKFETRKVIFDTSIALTNNLKEGILKAVDFELMWIKNNNENYNEQSLDDKNRIQILKSRFSS